MTIEIIYIFIIGFLVIRIYQLNEEKKILHSNYINCLRALAEYDPKLKDYIEKQNKKNS